MDITSFEQWTDVLHKQLELGRNLALSEDLIQKGAKLIGDYLAAWVEPDVPENKLLKEFWELADQSEKKAITSLMIKLVDAKYNRQ